MSDDAHFIETNLSSKHISLDARLSAAMDLLGSCDVFADIGCDHGRLLCAMLQQNKCQTAIASDLSLPSLNKAKKLSEHVFLSDRVFFRGGSGLSVLADGEADAIAILGMGGKLIAEILAECNIPLKGAKRAVLQPMRGVEDLRSYLWEKGYRIEQDRVIKEDNRFYQIFSVLPPNAMGDRDTIPSGFPLDFYTVGYRAFEQKDPLLISLVYRELNQCRKRLKEALGTDGEHRLMQKGAQLERIFKLLDSDSYGFPEN